MTIPILRQNLSVLTCHHNWRTPEVSLVEKILRVLEQFFIKSPIGLREEFCFQWSNQVQIVGNRRTAMRKRVGFGSQYTEFCKKRKETLTAVSENDIWEGGKAVWRPIQVAVNNQQNHVMRTFYPGVVVRC